MPEFTLSPNAYGRVAGGQEGSGQAQIFQPYDAAKFDRQAVEIEKQKQKAEKEKKANKVFEPDEVAIGIPTATVSKITEDAQGNKIEQGVQLLTVTAELEKEGAEIWKEGLGLSTKSPTYDEDYINYAKKYADWEYRRRKHENLAATTVENAKLQDKDIAILNGDRKSDIQASKTTETLDMLNKMPADKALEYRRSNPTVFWKSSYNFPQHQAAILKNVETMFMEAYGNPTGLVKDETSGKWTYITEKGERIDYDEAKKGFKTSYQFTVDGDEDLYNLLLTYVPDPTVLNANGSSATLSDMAIASDVPTLDRKAFAGYVWDKVPAISDMYMPMGDKVRTLSVVSEGGGGGDVNVFNTVKIPGQANVEKTVDYSPVVRDKDGNIISRVPKSKDAINSQWGGSTYSEGFSSLIARGDVMNASGTTQYAVTDAYVDGKLTKGITINIDANSNIHGFIGYAISDNAPTDMNFRKLYGRSGERVSDTQVFTMLKHGQSKYLTMTPIAKVSGTYNGVKTVGYDNMYNNPNLVDVADMYQRVADETSNEFFKGVETAIRSNKYKWLDASTFTYLQTLYQGYYEDGKSIDDILRDYDAAYTQTKNKGRAYIQVKDKYSGNTNQTGGNNQPIQGTSR